MIKKSQKILFVPQPMIPVIKEYVIASGNGTSECQGRGGLAGVGAQFGVGNQYGEGCTEASVGWYGHSCMTCDTWSTPLQPWFSPSHHMQVQSSSPQFMGSPNLVQWQFLQCCVLELSVGGRSAHICFSITAFRCFRSYSCDTFFS